ncbi:MAG: putative FtsW-like protein [Acidimicrobiales bacterium]|nr:MAG: FtsW/RodA/SpoVE family cell cycle protein [Actinomycetota bacterium]MBV6508077.1 putative FtsW-like protein [Acidimicrobiales bacterium]RIK05298.1 MAG: FtsW/RodA/SpoVE family cell cycle protein [Acidobacteriota bacterium]
MPGRVRRNTELGLILLGAVITIGAYILASLGRSDVLPADVVPFLVAVLVLLLGAHIANRFLAPDADGLLLPLAALLNGIGYVFIARLDEDLAGLQAMWTAVGIGLYIATLLVVRRTRLLERYRFTVGLLAMLLLLLPLVPSVGQQIGGARIWVSLGPVNFQPGEFAKIAFAVFFAGYLVERRELLGMATFKLGPVHIPDPKHLAPVVIAWGVSLVVMMFERDLGSALLFFVLFLVMLWIATQRVWYVATGFVLFGLGAWFSWTRFSHVQVRVSAWLDPWADPDTAGQIIEGTYAMAWGGLAGTGLGLGFPWKIPVVETDFIFAAIGEELGLLGATAVIVAFLLMTGSGLRIAARASDPFDKLLATGLTTLLAVQAFIIIGGVVRLLPLTGVTLPFVSYGGSSLLANYVLLALLVRISDQSSRRPATRPERERAAA